MGAEKRSKNSIRRQKSKLRKLQNLKDKVDTNRDKADATNLSNKTKTTKKPVFNNSIKQNNVEFEDDDLVAEYQSVFLKFQRTDNDRIESNTSSNSVSDLKEENERWREVSSEDDTSDESSDESVKLSRRQQRIRNKVPVSLLKASTSRPGVVEMSDIDALDPFLLVTIKSMPNVVQVPNHWSSKREYLSSRKGVERPPFELPKYIQDTGIQDMRGTDDRSLKQLQRDRVQPKMGKLDIDYEKLNDAFFKFQTKPRLFAFGDVYSEGREVSDEYIDEIAKLKPGMVSSRLRSALGLPEADFSIPPPWLAVFREIGRPPAYDSLTIPGLDIPYNNDGYKSLTGGQKNIEVDISTHWGKPQAYLESSDESESESESEHENVDESNLNLTNNETGNESQNYREEEPQKVEVSELMSHSKPLGATLSTGAENVTGSLYTVLEETLAKPNNSILSNEHAYDIQNVEVEEIKSQIGGSPRSATHPHEKSFKF